MVSALLLGGVLASLLFVGIWRHTAADGDRARAAQLADRQQLLATQRKLASLEAWRASERVALTNARLAQAGAAAELTQLRRLHRTIGSKLRSQLQALAATTGTLAHDTSSLKSEIAALRAYLRSASPPGVESGFVDAQIRYLVAANESANAMVSKLEQQTYAAQAAAAKLGQSAH